MLQSVITSFKGVLMSSEDAEDVIATMGKVVRELRTMTW